MILHQQQETFFEEVDGEIIKIQRPFYMKDHGDGNEYHSYKIIPHEEGHLQLSHSMQDQPAVVSYNGTKEWHYEGKRHRIGAPAIERKDGSYEWWVEGQRHRTDGPAHYAANCDNSMWFVKGIRVLKSTLIEMGIDPYNIEPEDIIMIELRYDGKKGFHV